MRRTSLDLIRILAICTIAGFHFFGVVGFYKTPLCLYANGGWGSVGTAIFFILSGYLLICNDSRTPVGTFYRKRALALFPIMDLMFVCFYLLSAIRKHDFLFGGNPWKIVFSLLGVDRYLGFYQISSYGVVGEWFTAIILAAYLLFPLMRLLYERSAFLGTVLFGGLYLLNHFLTIQHVPEDASVSTGLFLFWLGMLFFRFSRQIEHSPALSIALSALAGVLIFVKLPYIRSALIWKNMLGAALFLILLYLFRNTGKFSPVSRAAKFLSGLSFGVYLCHHYLIYRITDSAKLWIDHRLGRAFLCFAALLAVSCGISYVFTALAGRLTAALRRRV